MSEKQEKKSNQTYSKRQLISEAWRRGNLEYKLNPAQKKMFEAFEKNKDKIVPILASRRTGKTFGLLIRSIQICIQNPHGVVKFLCPTQKQVKLNLRPIMREILQDCPEPMKPIWMENEKTFRFPNGSEIQLAGTDNQAYNNLRGGSSLVCIVDEAGFCSDLYDAVFSVLQPTTATTRGQIFLASTPSKLATHDFIQTFVNPVLGTDKLPIFTIHDNTMIPEEEKEIIKNSYPGGEKNPEYRREYLCHLIQDAESVVIPEFDEEAQERLVHEVERPSHYDIYVSCDIGFKDLTVFLFGYYDFLKAQLVIVDEYVINGPELTTEKIARDIKQKEQELFHDPIDMNPLPIYKRIIDNNNLIFVNDLSRLHNLHFIPTAKDNKEAQINQLRMMISNRQLVIHPKCKHLIYHIRSASWDKHHKIFQHLPNIKDENGKDIKGAHADALDAVIYMVRNLVKSHNPYPAGWDEKRNLFKGKSRSVDDDFKTTIKRILNIK